MNEDIDISNLDAPPVNALEDIFVLPEHIAQNERIAGWYTEMVAQLLREAQGLPMKAAQYALMERIAYTYANMRYQEFTNPDLSERQRQANVDSWQKMLDQFNRLLEKHNDKLMTEMLVKVQDILKNRLPLISDSAERQALRRALGEDFAAMNL